MLDARSLTISWGEGCVAGGGAFMAGVCMAGEGACMAGGHVWQDVCVVGGGGVRGQNDRCV